MKLIKIIEIFAYLFSPVRNEMLKLNKNYSFRSSKQCFIQCLINSLGGLSPILTCRIRRAFTYEKVLAECYASLSCNKLGLSY